MTPEEEKRMKRGMFSALAVMFLILMLGIGASLQSVEAPAPVETTKAKVIKPTKRMTDNPAPRKLTTTEKFAGGMRAAGVPEHLLTFEGLNALKDQARATCTAIEAGLSKWQILESLGTLDDGEVKDALFAASAGGPVYFCPEYLGFWRN